MVQLPCLRFIYIELIYRSVNKYQQLRVRSHFPPSIQTYEVRIKKRESKAVVSWIDRFIIISFTVAML